MVVIAGDVPGIAVCDAPGLVAVGVPDARSAPVLVRGPLDLIARGRNAPYEFRTQSGAQRTIGHHENLT